MPKLSDLIATMVKCTDFPEKSVKLAARILRENGDITTGGRGFGGSEMVPKDATNLLIGLMSTYRLSDASQAVLCSRRATPHRLGSTVKFEHGSFADKDRFWDDMLSFGDALDMIIARAATYHGAQPPQCEFEVTFKVNREHFSANNKIKYATQSEFEEVQYSYHIVDDAPHDIKRHIRSDSKYKLDYNKPYTNTIVPHHVIMELSALFYKEHVT